MRPLLAESRTKSATALLLPWILPKYRFLRGPLVHTCSYYVTELMLALAQLQSQS